MLELAKQAGYKTIFVSDKKKFCGEDCYPRIIVKGRWSIDRFEKAIYGKVPIKEVIFEAIKNIAKFILRERGYNWLRKNLIRMFK